MNARTFGAGMMVLIATLAGSSIANAGTGINVETCSTYSNSYGCAASGDILGPNQEGNDFINQMTNYTNPVPFHLAQHYTDNSVFTTDLCDPSSTGYSSDSDWVYFDNYQAAFSYYAGHGEPIDGNTDTYPFVLQSCTSSVGQCNSPVVDQTGTLTFAPSFCLRYPGDTNALHQFGSCTYTSKWKALQLTNCINGGGGRSGQVFYSSNYVAWGNSVNATGWKNGDTRGGTNVVVLNASYAQMSERGQEIWGAFGGIHLLLTTLNHTGDIDVGNTEDRGLQFGHEYLINPNQVVADAWVNAMASTSGGGSCLNYARNTPYGGGQGYNGCGGVVSTSMGATAAEAAMHIGEVYNDVANDSKDGKGNGFWSSTWTCNYDCNTWSFAFP